MASNTDYAQKCITIEHTKQHTHTIILLHGRDSNASDFKTDFFESQASDDRYLTDIFPSIKWVLPQSKQLYSARFEQDLSQWFDIWSVEKPEEKKEMQVEGLKESIEMILSLVREEAELVGMERIILGGISQGCATAVMALLVGGIGLGGFVGFSSWLPFQEEIDGDGSLRAIKEVLKLGFDDYSDPTTDKSSNLATPVLIQHCKDDEVVPVCNGQILRTRLHELGMSVAWKMYEEGGHWVNEPKGIDDLVAFIRKCFDLR